MKPLKTKQNDIIQENKRPLKQKKKKKKKERKKKKNNSRERRHSPSIYNSDVFV